MFTPRDTAPLGIRMQTERGFLRLILGEHGEEENIDLCYVYVVNTQERVMVLLRDTICERLHRSLGGLKEGGHTETTSSMSQQRARWSTEQHWERRKDGRGARKEKGLLTNI